jgi:histidinol phosphatase-like PHP family hydrolase
MLPKLDLHTHSIHSDGHQTFEEIFKDFTPPTGYFNLFRIGLQCGVKLNTGSDAHRLLHMGDLSKIHATLTQMKAKPSDIYSPAN